MPVFRWGQAWDTFHDLEREVDQLLASVQQSMQLFRLGREYPPVNLYARPHEFLLTTEIPGVKPEDLEITVNQGVLTIRGQRLGPEGIPDEKYRRQERPRGRWQRSFPLPDRILEDELSAELSNGVLIIRLPRAPLPQPRQIKVIETK